jgi:membrane protein DedA with SNARE-associated domain
MARGTWRRLGPIQDKADMGHSDVAVVGAALVAQALKEVGVPSPGVTQGALVYAGYQVASGHILVGSTIIAAVYAGSLGGALIAYAIGRSVGTRLVNRPSRYLHLSARNLERAKARLGTRAPWAVAGGRMVPAVMAALSVAAGVMRMSVASFAGGVSLNTLAWAALLACLGAVCGPALDSLAPSANLPLLVALTTGAILVASLACLWWRSMHDAGGHGVVSH